MARDTASLNTNPAGLARIDGWAFDHYGAVAYALDVAHADRFGNDRSVSNNIIPLGDAGFARHLHGTPVVVGIGLFAQGGAGAVFKDLVTPFGTRDEISALTGIAKLTPGLAWQATDALSLGAGVSAVYARSKQRIFPSTSVFNRADPAHSFFGSELQDADTLRYGLRLGIQYRPRDDLTLGADFADKVSLPLSGGRLDVNFGALGLGDVTHRDVHADGLALPREISLGAAWQASAAMLLSFKLSRLYWSGALATLTLTARNPSNPLAPAEIHNVTTLNWHDQTVIALGMRLALGERTALLAGANYGRRPMADDTLSPIFAPIGQKHLTLGLMRRLGREYVLSGGIEYLLPEHVRYNNPELPFGPGTQARVECVALHLMLSRRW